MAVHPNDSTRIPAFGTRIDGARYTPRPAAYAVIEDGAGRFAFIRVAGRLFLVGGGIEAGETAEQAVAREAREECAREIAIASRIGEARQYFEAQPAFGSLAPGSQFDMTATFFEAAFSSEADAAAEHELVWRTLEDAETEIYHECQAWAIREYLAQRSRVV